MLLRLPALTAVDRRKILGGQIMPSALFIILGFLALASSAYADDRYICESPLVEGQKPLVVKYGGGVATEILFAFKRADRADSYQIKQRDDIYYRADEASPDAPDAFASLQINRLSGELEVTSRISKDAVELLAGICDRRIPRTECIDRMSKITGGSLAFCLFGEPAASCDRWRKGTNVSGPYTYQCKRTEQ
jgi:hypothetical protein